MSLPKDKSQMTAEQRQRYLDDLLDEYHQCDFEDIIADGVTTRFKYVQVPKEDFGLTSEEILLLDDKKLNQIVSLKKYRPFREQESDQQRKINVYKTIQKKKELRREVQD